MAIGMGNLLDAFVENGLTNHVKGGILHMSRPPQAVEVGSEADLETLGELPAGSIAYTAEYAHMWQLTSSGTWAATEEKGDGGFAPDITNPQDGDTLVYNATAGKWVNGSGGGGGAMVLTVTKTTVEGVEVYTLDATYAQTKAALLAGTEVFFVDDMETEVVKYTLNACEDGGTHDYNYAYFNAGSNSMTFEAAAEDDLLHFNMG